MGTHCMHSLATADLVRHPLADLVRYSDVVLLASINIIVAFFFAKTFMLMLVIIKLIRLMMKGFGTIACISCVAHIRS